MIDSYVLKLFIRDSLTLAGIMLEYNQLLFSWLIQRGQGCMSNLLTVTNRDNIGNQLACLGTFSCARGLTRRRKE